MTLIIHLLQNWLYHSIPILKIMADPIIGASLLVANCEKDLK